MASRGGDKIEKIIARMQQRIVEGQFYEAQQQTRAALAGVEPAEQTGQQGAEVRGPGGGGGEAADRRHGEQ